MRTVKPRIDMLRNGIKIAELISVSTPSCTFSASSTIKSSFNGSFLPDSAVDWMTDEIRPVMVIDGEDIPFGIYLPATISDETSDGIRTINVEAYDRCWLAESTKTESVLHLSEGSNYITVINSLLVTCGISLILATPTDYTLRADREDWDIGTDYLTIINQLLDEINYNELWFNSDGWAMLEPEQTLSASNITKTYTQNDAACLLRKESSVQTDLYNAPNVFLCVCANPDDDSTMTAKSENVNPQSPLSIVRRGRRIMQVYKLDNIADQDALQDYADLLAMESTFIGQAITVSTGVQSPAGLNAAVALVLPDVSGVCRETGYTVEFAAGASMTHELEKIMGVS